MKGLRIFLLLVCFLAISVFVRYRALNSRILNQQDCVNYARTVFQYSNSLRAGSFFPRLSRFDVEGQGYPVFQYYPPLSFAVPGAVSLLLGVNVAVAVNLAIGMGYVAIGFSFLCFARSIGLNRHASFCGAVALLAYPYVGHLSFLNTPMFFGFCAGSFVLAAMTSLVRGITGIRLFALYLATVLLCLTHVLSILLFLPLSLLLLVLVARSQYGPGGLARTARLAGTATATTMLGLLSCSFQLGPVLEAGTNHWLRVSNLLSSNATMASFGRRFTTLPELFSFSASRGVPLATGAYDYRIGPVFLAAIFFTFAFLFVKPAQRLLPLLFLLVVLATIAAMNPAVLAMMPGWVGVFQFPTRFLALVAFPCAALVGFAVQQFAAEIRRRFPAFVRSPLPPIGGSAVLCAGMLALSLHATQDLSQIDDRQLTHLPYPLPVEKATSDPASTYSSEYLLDPYHFFTHFPSEPLMGHTQYFIYNDRGFAENEKPYALPGANDLPRGVIVRGEGMIPAGIDLPQQLDFLLNGILAKRLTIERRAFRFEFSVPPGITKLTSIAYRGNHTTIVDAKPVVAQFTTIMFEGLPADRSVVSWKDYHFEPRWDGNRFQAHVTNLASRAVYSIPVLAYPGLQSLRVNGRPQEPLLVPDNDLVYCGVPMIPGMTYDIQVVFSGSAVSNLVSLMAAGIAALALAGRAFYIRGFPGVTEL